MTRILIAALTAVLSLFALPGAAEAKTCKCDQHTADATAAGDCKRTETDTFCSIRFPGEEVKDNEREEFQQKLDVITPIYGKQLQFDDIFEANWILRNYKEKPASGGTLTTLALSALPLEQIAAVAEQFARLFNIEGEAIRRMISDFNERGCFEASEGTLRILVISANSERNRECKE